MSKEVSEEKHQPVVSLTMRDVRLREAAGNVFRIIAPLGTTPERLEESSFYSVISHQFHPFDELIVIAADRTFYARYLVLQAGMGYVEVFQLSFIKLPAMLASIGETLPDNHRLVYAGPEIGWQAIRSSDGVVVIDRATSQTDCLQQLLNHGSLRK
ncbi:hypothetical protein F3I62_03555 [Pseudomonas sp. R-28-1W-6]|uniref:hypothetical protein n=1 Tax=Pseudomonas sp. R-28-1W-6 TaxID=2650101 RepID=UPI0013660BCE|nr:hypothetical protein [Pseudomonas sp. R-28-1W-6]MWV11164.1 hypothetical protein [Pseudomonas sp. R-28-1W-6]